MLTKFITAGLEMSDPVEGRPIKNTHVLCLRSKRTLKVFSTKNDGNATSSPSTTSITMSHIHDDVSFVIILIIA